MNNANCPHAQDVAASLSGELSDDAQLAFRRHLRACASCRSAMESQRVLLECLRAVSSQEMSRDLAPAVLAQIREVPPVTLRKPALPVWSRMAAAAALVLLAAVGWHGRTPPPAQTASNIAAMMDETSESASRALDFFCDSQEADGSWSPARWGGHERFAPVLTALPLLALLDGEPAPEHCLAAEKAVGWLQRQQRQDGTFCSPFYGAPFIQSVCTLALLHAYQQKPDPSLKRAVDSALRIVLRTQRRDGGWGYDTNHSLTLWHRDVVELAAALGWEEARASHARALQWLAAYPMPPLDAVTLGEGGVTDFHRVYFAAASLRHQHSDEAQTQLAAIRQNLVSHQSAAGEASGTWEPKDQWSRAGGRIYTTALAAMTLR